MGSELNLETTESSWTGGWFSWTRQSDAMLRHVEKKILSCLKTAYKRFYVDIGSVVGQSDKIWTVSLNDESSRTPLVMLHGMGAGLALWCPNFDALAETRPVYAIDLLGFGRSSRPKFATEALKAEAQWVESVEEWRREVNLPQFILLGHSLGGYIATSYAMKYPERVRHLILADPWGFPGHLEEVQRIRERRGQRHPGVHLPVQLADAERRKRFPLAHDRLRLGEESDGEANRQAEPGPAHHRAVRLPVLGGQQHRPRAQRAQAALQNLRTGDKWRRSSRLLRQTGAIQ